MDATVRRVGLGMAEVGRGRGGPGMGTAPDRVPGRVTTLDTHWVLMEWPCEETVRESAIMDPEAETEVEAHVDPEAEETSIGSSSMPGGGRSSGCGPKLDHIRGLDIGSRLIPGAASSTYWDAGSRTML